MIKPGQQPYQLRPHWLRQNHRESTPHRVVIFDTESHIDTSTPDEKHTLRHWHAKLIRRHVNNPRAPIEAYATGSAQDEFARTIDSWATTKATLWCFAHNLSYDLTTTNVLDNLWKLGWELTDLNINSRNPWVRIRNGRRRIIFTDSHSWLNAPLEYIASQIGMGKVEIDDWEEATDTDIQRRCAIDVEILTRAMLLLMQWWDDNNMGRWAWSGPGCGWSIYRHKFLHDKILMDMDPERCRFERRAIYGGRREAFRIGTLEAGYYVDLDFANAYPKLASCTPVPTREIGRLLSVDTDKYMHRPANWGVVAECTVTTNEPLVPCRISGTVVYPVGTFKTTLASPDIDALLSNGAHVEMGKAIVYKLAPVMDEWGKWICKVITDTSNTYHPLVKTMCKNHSRTVIGRWAMHKTVVEDWGSATYPWFHMETGKDLATDTPIEWVDVLGKKLHLTHTAEPQNGFPAITAWIEATCRQYLNQAMKQCSDGVVLQCDTDGFLLGWIGEDDVIIKGHKNMPGKRWIAGTGPTFAPTWPQGAGPLMLKTKGLYRNAHIRGPQQMVLDDKQVMSGIPRNLAGSKPFEWSGWTWPGFKWQMANSTPGIYTRPHVHTSIRGPYGNRWVLRNGETIPVEVQQNGSANAIIDPKVSTLVPLPCELNTDQPYSLSTCT